MAYGLRPKASCGFTLIEMLVVIVIIGILISLVAIAVSKAMQSARVSSSETFLANVAEATKQYQIRWGDYPPSMFREIGGRARNSVNEGVETLVACLSSERKGKAVFKPEGDRYVNTDKDAATKNVTKWYFGDNKLREYRDFLGFVVAYVHHRDYRKRDGFTYKVVVEAKKEVKMKPQKDPATATWYGSGRFQLVSPGTDGIFGTQDDIRPPGN